MYFENDYEIKMRHESEFRDLVRVAQNAQLLEKIHPRHRAATRRSARATLFGLGHFLLGIVTFLNVLPLAHRR